MKYLLIAGLLTACNFGLVDVHETKKTCYNRTHVIGIDSSYIDSVAFDCTDTRVTTPFDHFMDPIIK